jgi:putative oxidoreductase
MSLRQIYENRTNEGLLVLRVGAGLFMALGHGLTKLRAFPKLSSMFPDPLGIGSAASLTFATGAEFLAALLLALGLFARPSAAALAFTMGVAGFLQHAPDPFAKRELALLYGIIFLALALTGPGSFSLDAWFARKRETRGTATPRAEHLAVE